MRKRTYWKNRHGYLWGVMLMAVALCFTSCKDDDEQENAAFDPTKPVVITNFTPKEASYGSDIVLYGENFGNDPSKVKVTIGGKNARIIGLKNQSIYCVVPKSATKKNVQLEILNENGEAIALAKAEEEFTYIKKWLVSTFIGTHYEESSQFVEKDGPFNDCGGFNNVFWFSWDPKSNFDKLYFTTEGKNIRLIDFTKENADGTKGYVSTLNTRFTRVTAMTWTAPTDNAHDQDMIYSENHSSDSKEANYLYTRASGFKNETLLGGYARGVNGNMVHPINGEFYFSRYRAGDVWRYDFATNTQELAFPLPYSGVATYMVPHPTGNYAYLLLQERYYIARTDYDWASKTFTAPYTICGQPNDWGYVDAVGTRAKINRPIQGVFVYNPEYEGQKDEYDFYFCDKNNHCIRILTPTGRITTFAGRGNNKESGYNDGDLRSQALFSEPRAIAYDEKRNCFYVGDGLNKVIRKIELERTDDEQEAIEDENDGNVGSEGEENQKTEE